MQHAFVIATLRITCYYDIREQSRGRCNGYSIRVEKTPVESTVVQALLPALCRTYGLANNAGLYA
jgi:hypothetical protein